MKSNKFPPFHGAIIVFVKNLAALPWGIPTWVSTQMLEYLDDQTSEKACKNVPGSGNLADPATKILLLTTEKEAPWPTLARSTFTAVKQ